MSLLYLTLDDPSSVSWHYGDDKKVPIILLSNYVTICSKYRLCSSSPIGDSSLQLYLRRLAEVRRSGFSNQTNVPAPPVSTSVASLCGRLARSITET
jgi:hypothetical protein